ncbi:cardiolipin synthase [Staphylococcus succinus]|uniref:cardiolipin synthase n=1 Tax=Staphylococcus succinus TaxID=61015 RepID=UPI00062B8C43|nr:cardiolipin synthase [Staphylococcus succinus]MDH9161650.1 cardiolipin synthase [Staphylococcus succinus]MEB8123661.1 cardiolipin synthase [Staphylococcus succinus]PNZ19620.1 cardiolipin synthase [Staphylococcus succinus subsp. succinus]RIN25304.1 cardiolipin synthase [Staphylococcus succinus]RIN44529.1 cardiolipin synthase [Staphylococcus succinus]
MQLIFDASVSPIYRGVLAFFFIINIVLALLIVFLDRDRRDATATWAWLFLLFVMPILGFIVYIFFGRGIRKKREKGFQHNQIEDGMNRVKAQLQDSTNHIFNSENPIVRKHADIAQTLMSKESSFLSNDNKVDIYTDGHDLYDQMKADLRNAKSYIHMEYYVLELDGLGTEIINILEQKASEGLEVKLLYDAVGSKTVHKSKFKKFQSLGGQVEAFFKAKIPFVNFRVNNRNHRKIVVIDGMTGYVGGFNIGDEYLGLNEKFGYWRDTHLRVKGDGVDALQLSFIHDWNSQAKREQLDYNAKYFPDNAQQGGDVSMQMAVSAPSDNWHQIEFGYMKMIMNAKESIYMHSPYFIPDKGYINALRIAAKSGVDVQLIIPCKPDHIFVYWATITSVAQLIKDGVKVYTYENGFIHSKMMIIDDEVSSVGSSNMDIRSFELNFEINAFMYDEQIAKKLKAAFFEDLKVSKELTIERYEQRSNWIKFKQAIAKLASPIL